MNIRLRDRNRTARAALSRQKREPFSALRRNGLWFVPSEPRHTEAKMIIALKQIEVGQTRLPRASTVRLTLISSDTDFRPWTSCHTRDALRVAAVRC